MPRMGQQRVLATALGGGGVGQTEPSGLRAQAVSSLRLAHARRHILNVRRRTQEPYFIRTRFIISYVAEEDTVGSHK